MRWPTFILLLTVALSLAALPEALRLTFPGVFP